MPSHQLLRLRALRAPASFHFPMSTNRFVTAGGITLEYFTEVQTLQAVRYWHDHPNTDRCEAWFKGADGIERRWYSLPLAVQGRAGHRYRLCWARTPAMESYELVGARNLATTSQCLASSTGLVASLFPPARYGRWAFGLSFLGTAALMLTHPSLMEDPRWVMLLALPPTAGVAGLCASLVRNRRDPERTFDRIVLTAMGAD